MKKLILATLLFASVAYANQAEQNQRLLVDALTSYQTVEAVAQYRKGVDFTEDVQFENYRDVDVITLRGMKLVGGDVPCGAAELKITRTWQPFIGFNRQAVFKAETKVTRKCGN
jgi:hypothetical protein